MGAVMRNLWLGYAPEGAREELEAACRQLCPTAELDFVRSAEELRMRSRREAPQGVVVGPDVPGVSDINVAAAIARDASVRAVYLVTRSPTGSLLSRANIAGIDEVVELSRLPAGARAPLSDPSAREAAGSGGARVPGGSREGSPLPGPELDEPELEADLVPTTLVSEPPSRALGLPRVSGLPGEARARAAGLPGADGAPAGRRPDGGPVRRAGSRGFSAPAVRPPEPEGERVRQAPARIAVAPAPRAPILTFVSGRGGVGKTTLVATSACVAASWGLRVALCDMDLAFGSLYSCFGMPGPADLTPAGEMLEMEEDLVERLGAEATEGVRLWGGCERPEMAETVMPHVAGILDVLAHTSDLVLVDTSATFTDAVAQAAQCADRLLITVDEGPGSAVAQARLASLAVRLGVARTRIVRVANRSDPRRRDVPVIDRGEVGLETARSFRVVDGGEEVGEFMGAGEARRLSEGRSEYVSCVSDCVAQLLGELGRLPEGASTKAPRTAGGKRRRWVFGRRREAV